VHGCAAGPLGGKFSARPESKDRLKTVLARCRGAKLSAGAWGEGRRQHCRARGDQMPFDGVESYGTVQLAKLGAVERMLATEQQWCKGRLRDAQGRHCLVGAIEAVEGRQMLQRVILHAAREVSGKRYWRIEFFNDDPHTTHADVLAVLH